MTIDKFGRTSGSTSTSSTTGVTKTYVHETFLEDNPIENDIDFQNTYTCINVKDPVNDQDTATKSYVDNLVSNTTNKAYIAIKAEKNNGLTGGADNFSFGNGTQNSLVGFTMMTTGRVLKAGINVAPANYSATIGITVNGDIQSNYLFSKVGTPSFYKGQTTDFSTPLELGVNDSINFRTITATVGITECVVNLLIELDMD